MVSHTMGLYPNDKLYVFIMNLFTAVQFANYRAFYKKFNGIISPKKNTAIFIAGLITLITGPALALCDYHPWDEKEVVPKIVTDIHVNSTFVFVVCQLFYLF